jgi:hypothetical protein
MTKAQLSMPIAVVIILMAVILPLPSIVLDTARLRKALPGWAPRVTFADGIDRMWDAALARAVPSA